MIDQVDIVIVTEGEVPPDPRWADIEQQIIWIKNVPEVVTNLTKGVDACLTWEFEGPA